jgi:hypothetical protein
MAVASGTVRIEINELEEPSDHVVPKINGLHQVSFDDVLDVCESPDHAVLNDDADRGLRLLVRGRLRGRTVRVILYPIDIDRGTWRLRPPEVVVRMACDQGFFFALDYRKGVEIW